jgi:hypothetical protein
LVYEKQDFRIDKLQFRLTEKSTVLHCCQAWFEEGSEVRVPGSDRRRSTTAAQDQYLTIMALRDHHNSTRRVVWC